MHNKAILMSEFSRMVMQIFANRLLSFELKECIIYANFKVPTVFSGLPD